MAQYIGETIEGVVANGNHYYLQTKDMTGKIYEPGKKADGKFIDTVGKVDERIMVYTNDFYKVYNSASDVFKDWRISSDEWPGDTRKFQSRRVLAEI